MEQRFVEFVHVGTGLAHVAHLLVDGGTAAQQRCGLFVAFQVNQVVGFIAYAKGQQVTVGRGHGLYDVDGLLGRLRSQFEAVATVVAVAQLRQVVGHAFIEADGACSLYGALAKGYGPARVTGLPVDIAGNPQRVVGIAVDAKLVVSLYGLLHEPFRIIILLGVQIDDGEVEIGTRQLQQVVGFLAGLHGQAFCLDGFGTLACFVEGIAQVAEQGCIDMGMMILGQRQCTAAVVYAFGKVGIVVVETLCGEPYGQIKRVGRQGGDVAGRLLVESIILLVDIHQLSPFLILFLCRGFLVKGEQRINGADDIGHSLGGKEHGNKS